MSGKINTTPVTLEKLAAKTGRSIEEIEGYFQEECGGYDRYVELCKDPRGLELFLLRLVKEFKDKKR